MNISIDTRGSVSIASGVQRDINRGLSRVIEPLSFIVMKYAKLALTDGPTRAIRTGYLRASIDARVSGLRGIIRPNTNYAYFIHEGTSRMKGRPYMVRAVDLSVPEMKAELIKAINNQIR